MGKKQLVMLVALLLALLLSGCSPTEATEPAVPATPTTPAAPPTSPAPTAPGSLLSISSSPAATEIRIKNTRQLDITAVYSDGTRRSVTDKCTYKSEDEKIVTVSATGLVTGVGAGSTSVTISYTEDQVTQTVSVPIRIYTGFLGQD